MELFTIILCSICLLVVVVLLYVVSSMSTRMKQAENSDRRHADEAAEAARLLKASEERQAAEMQRIMQRQDEQNRHQVELLNRQYETRLEAIQTRHEQQLASMQVLQEQQLSAMQERHDRQLAAIKEEYVRTRTAEQQKALSERETLKAESAAQFERLAATIIKTQTDGLKQQNMEQIEALLKPLSENIAGFRKAVTDSYVSENASRQSLTDQIDRLMKLNESIGTEARNLTSALKSNSKVQGDWGEMILETMLENAGLEKGIHFQTQLTRDDAGAVLTDDEGRRQRPDVVVNMPDARRLIIDSKVSLTAFTQYCAAETADAQDKFLREHLVSVKRHIDELAAKKYHQFIEGSADYTMMFIPNEGAYIAAVQHDSDLWQYAYSRHVAIVSPTHLFSSMRIVSQLWVQDKQNRNTLEIARKGGALFDKVMLFLSAMQEVGTALDKARDSYDTAISRLSTGRGSVAKLSQDLMKLGAKATKAMPQTFAARLEADEDIDDLTPEIESK